MTRVGRIRLRRNAAFTLLELLVVMGILIIITSIGIAAFVSLGKVSRLTATEQLLTDLIRQARYTARTTGQAVILYVDPATRSISGVTRLAIWSSSAETGSEPFEAPTPTLDPLQFQTPFGHSGAGFTRLAGATTQATVTLFDPAIPADRIHINRQLTRRPVGKATEGFQLTAVVREQRIYQPGAAPALAPAVLPLVVIGPDGMAAPPLSETAYAGLALRRATTPMFGGTGAGDRAPLPATTSSAGGPLPLIPVANPDRIVWELVGWILPEGTTTPILVSEIDEALQPDESLLSDNDLAKRIAPDVGGQWHEVSLLYTGASLELFRDGRTIARKTLTGAPRVAGYGAAHLLSIGGATVGATLAPAGLGAGSSAQIDDKTVIDDISLFRLGVDLPHQLPAGVEPGAAYRIAVHPNGRIVDLATGAIAGTITWIFRGVFNEVDDTATLNIECASGRISSSKVALSRSAP